jgi:GNAT superfamily N-acetyltransferase
VTEAADIEVHPVTAERWDDVADLFQRPGPRGGRPPTAWCWCMWWRDRSHNVAKNRAAMRELVSTGQEPGLLAYLDGMAVGWISMAPRQAHGQLVRSPTLKPPVPDEPGVLAITCFYVHPSARRRGVARALVGRAVEHARERGAAAVEAYAADRLAGTSSTDFMGTGDWFLEEGFQPVRRARSKTVMRLDLMPGGDGAPAPG